MSDVMPPTRTKSIVNIANIALLRFNFAIETEQLREGVPIRHPSAS